MLYFILKILGFFCVGLIFLININIGNSFSATIIGKPVNINIQSPHPYPDGDISRPVVWTKTINHPGATFMQVHFANFHVEGSKDESPFLNDYVAILDKNGNEVSKYEGKGRKDKGTFWSHIVKGDTITIELHANSKIQCFGFDIDKYIYGLKKAISTGPPGEE